MTVSQKISGFAVLDVAATGDVLPIVQDPTGVPVTKQIAVGDLKLFIDITAAEIAAGVTPTNLLIAPGHAFRFGLDEAATDVARGIAIQAALDSSDWVKIPAGTWTTDVALQWNSNNHIRGEGMDVTIVKLGEAANQDENVFEPKLKDSSIINWSIKDITFDGNNTRATVSPPVTNRPGSTCIATMGASFGYIRDVKVKNGVKHCLDISNGGEVEVGGERNYVLAANEAPGYYPSNESQFIDIDNIHAENALDDAIVGHYSKNISVGVIYGFSTGGTEFGYAVEVDDGCRDWTIDRVVAIGGNTGFGSKNHAPQPAPSGIMVNSITTIGCQRGVYVDGDGGGTVEDSGKRISIGQIIVRFPVDFGNADPFIGVEINAASDIDIGSIICIANGDESFTLKEAVQIDNASKRITIGRIIARNWPYNNTADSGLAAVNINSGNASDISIGQTILEDCGWRGVRVAGTPDRVNLGSINAKLTSGLSGSTAVRIVGDVTATKLTILNISNGGYDTGSSITPVGVSVDGQPVNDGRVEILKATETATGTFTAALDRDTTDIDSTAALVAVTLPDGVIDGQRKKFTMSNASNSSTVSVTSHETSDPEIFTFAQITDILILEWDASNAFWWTVKNIGAAV